MKNKLIPLLCFFLLCSHDMYLKMDTFFLEPNKKNVIDLYNGTFEKSGKNKIKRIIKIDLNLNFIYFKRIRMYIISHSFTLSNRIYVCLFLNSFMFFFLIHSNEFNCS